MYLCFIFWFANLYYASTMKNIVLFGVRCFSFLLTDFASQNPSLPSLRKATLGNDEATPNGWSNSPVHSPFLDRFAQRSRRRRIFAKQKFVFARSLRRRDPDQSQRIFNFQFSIFHPNGWPPVRVAMNFQFSKTDFGFAKIRPHL